MSEERLQEIKDSISLQYKVQEANDLNNFNIFTDEEQELVDEIERLNNIIKEVREYCNNYNNFEIMTDFDTFENHNIIGKDILEILDKVGSEKE